MLDYRMTWSHGSATVASAAAMLTDLVFDLPGGPFRPLARAPWLDEPHAADDPDSDAKTHLDVLGGEFPCVPFGGDHGFGANTTWDIESDGRGITARVSYPEGDPIRRLERRVTGTDGKCRLQLSLTVEARHDVRLPIGVHPILRLPEEPGGLTIDASFARGYTYPGPQTTSAVADRHRSFADLWQVPGPEKPVDLSRLPLADDRDSSLARRGIDDVVMLCGARSPVTVNYVGDDAELDIEWDDTLLPSVNYWYSDRGLPEAPWHGRYRGLGVEPASAYFDLGPTASVESNPVSDAGFPTTIMIAGGSQVRIEYALTARRRATATTKGSPDAN
jgi:hypothetical protein